MTSFTIPTQGNTATFTVGTGLSYTTGETVIVYNNSANYFVGTVTNYNSGTGSISVLVSFDVVGAGNTQGTWNVNLQGNTGATGASGTSGTSGTVGATGDSGTSGTSGTVGATGDPGTSGTSGTAGPTGDPGTSGTSGTSGTAGPTGAAGPTGSQGPTGGGGGGGVYYAKGSFISSALQSPLVAAEDPDGNNLLSDPNWTFSVVAGNEIQITHNVGKWATDFNRYAENSSGVYLTANVGISATTGNYVTQNSAKTSIQIKGITPGFTGVNSGSGPFTIYYTWKFPDNDITL